MIKLIKDIKKLTNFFQFLQDFNPNDYKIETPPGNTEDLDCDTYYEDLGYDPQTGEY